MHNVDIRNISLGQMQYFVKVAEYKNITRAAQYFHIGQPTLSKRLKSLEEQLDLQLFMRGKNTLALTPAGRYIYETWRHRIEKMEEEIQYAHVLQAGHSKSIVAACLDSFRPEIFFLPLIEEFVQDNPDVQIRIESDAAQDIRRMLLSKEVDVIFSIGYDFEEKEMEEIEWKLLGPTPHCACMKRTNPLAQKERLSVDDLKQADFVCISPQYLPEYIGMIQAMCGERGFAPNITKYVSSANSLTLNLLTDRDIFVCDKYYADLNQEGHVRVPICDTQSGFVMAWRKNSGKSYLEDFVEAAMWKYE